jgi:transcriptional regulator with XRE-family HTH domain
MDKIWRTISKEEIEEIKRLLQENKLTKKEISEKFDVSESTILMIEIGKIWTRLI